MRGAIVAGLVVAGLLCALAGRGSPPAAQPTQPAGPGPLPAPGARIGPDDVVVEDWQTGPLGQMGVPAGWEGQTWGKTSAFAVSVVLDEGQRVLRLESHNDRATITRDLHGRVSLARTPILRWRWKVRPGVCSSCRVRVSFRGLRSALVQRVSMRELDFPDG